MNEPTGPARVRAALELLTEVPAELLMALAGHGRCRACGVLVPAKGERQHQLWHQALAVQAGRVFNVEAGS